ncbi:MAG: hypothetical protein AB1499_00575 [Nitrospirota bacterium]
MKKSFSRSPLQLAITIILITMIFPACKPSTKKIDEVIFYNGPNYKLKLVRYHENLPFHYVGEVFRVLCSSAQTANSPEHKTQDRGWVTLGNGGAIGSKSADELVERERANYHVQDDLTLVTTGKVLRVSFNACGTFHNWDPTTLPANLIDPVEKPSYCAPAGTADCRYYDFEGDREPIYEDVQTSPEGKVSFKVSSKTFKDIKALIVNSSDFGKTWSYTVINQ